MTSRITVRAITAAVAMAAGAIALAGCSGDPGGSASTPEPSALRSDATSAPKVVGTRVTQTCDELLPAGSFDVYGKDFVLQPDARPARGTPAATIAAQRGRVCVFRDDTDDLTVTVAVAHLPEKSLTNLKDALYEQSNSVPTYGVEGYFMKPTKTGRADAFADPYWIDARSTMFGEPGDAEPVIDAVRDVLVPSSTTSPTGAATTPAG